MKKSICLVLILGGLQCCYAQKDAPVVGNAIELVQLLTKDYESVAPEIRGEQLIRDRAEVIDIFKSYLRQLELEKYNESINKKLGKKPNGLLYERDSHFVFYSRKKEKYEAFKRGQIRSSGYRPEKNDKDTAGELVFINYLEHFDTTKNEAQQAYFNSQFSVDSVHFESLIAMYKDNKYLQNAVKEFKEKYQAVHDISKDLYADKGASLTVQKGLPFIGGDLAFETVIDGLSRFLAERIKDELTTFVIAQVQDELMSKSDETPFEELGILLPTTMEYLLEFDANQILNFTDEIKQYVEKDLNNILDNLANLKDARSVQRLLLIYPDIDFAFEALELIPQLKKIKHPVEFLEILDNSRNLSRWEASNEQVRHNIANAINMSVLLGRSFTVLQSGQLEFANLEDIDLYLDNNHFFQMYFGFLYQQDAKYYQVNFIIDEQKQAEKYKYLAECEFHQGDTLATKAGTDVSKIDMNQEIVIIGESTPKDLILETVLINKVPVKEKKYILKQGSKTLLTLHKIPCDSTIKLEDLKAPIYILEDDTKIDSITQIRREALEIQFVPGTSLILKYPFDVLATISGPQTEFHVICQDSTLSVYELDAHANYHLPLGSIMQEFMVFYNEESIVELNEARSHFESLFSNMGVQVKEVTSLATEIRKINKRGEKVALNTAHDFVGGVLDFTESLALTGDTIWNYLIRRIYNENKQINYFIHDTIPGKIEYRLAFTKEDRPRPIDYKIELESKAASYISTGRSANEIILDLHEKKYVNAITGAFDLAVELYGKDDLSELAEITEMMASINRNEWHREIRKLNKFIDKNGEFVIKEPKDLKKNALNLYELLIDWETFYNKNLLSKPVDPRWTKTSGLISLAKALMLEIYNDRADASINIAPTKALFTDPYFGKILLTYYTDIHANKLIDEFIYDKLINLKKVDRFGNLTSVLDIFQQDQLKKLIDEYIKNMLSVIFHKGKNSKSERKAFQETNQKLLSFVSSSIGTFGNKLDIDPNSQIFKIIHLLNDVAQSENAEDVENAIENFALPSGSFAIKRNSIWTLSLDSYPGLLVGRERVLNSTTGAPAPKTSAGFTAPIGLSYTWGIKAWGTKIGSFGIFTPIIDIGTFTRFRFDSGNETTPFPELTFKNVFSPGMYVVYGFPKAPLSISFGAQYGPEIRTLDENGAIEDRYESWRCGFGLTLDIPLFKIYTKPRLFID